MTRQFNAKYTLGDSETSQSAAGTTQATARQTFADHVWVPSITDGAGVILHAGNNGEERSVVNADASGYLSVYPPVGSSFNGKTANAAVSLPPNTGARFRFHDALTIAAFL